VRNRERVLEAAKAVFSAGGSEASLEAVARHAGVGIGTLYRHFPTREALYEAVYRREVEQLGDLAEQLERAPETVEALRRWLRANVEFVATKKGMVAALALVAHGSTELARHSFDRLTRAIGTLLARAVAAGEIRGDISADDVLRALIGMCYYARPARLAIDRAAAAGCVRRRLARAGGGQGGRDEENLPRRKLPRRKPVAKPSR